MNTAFLYSQNKTLLLCISSWGWGSIQSMAHTLLNSQRKKASMLLFKNGKKNFFLKVFFFFFWNCSLCYFFTGILWGPTVTFRYVFFPSFLNTLPLADNQKKHFKWRSHGSISGRSDDMQTLTIDPIWWFFLYDGLQLYYWDVAEHLSICST